MNYPTSPPGAEKALRMRLNQAERPHTAGAAFVRHASKSAPSTASFSNLLLAVQNAQEECQRGFEGRKLEEGPGFLSVSFLSGSDIRAALKHGATVIQKTSSGYSMFPWTAACNAMQHLRQARIRPHDPHRRL